MYISLYMFILVVACLNCTIVLKIKIQFQFSFWLLNLFLLATSFRTAYNCRSLQSCRHEGWNSIAKYLVEDVPLNLKLDDVKDVQGVLSVVFKSPPADLSEFIKWVAEVRRQEDGSLILSEEEKGRLAVKVCLTFVVLLYLDLYYSTLSVLLKCFHPILFSLVPSLVSFHYK